MNADPGMAAHELLQHGSFVRRLAAALSERAVDVDDAVQQVWLSTLIHPPKPGRGLKSWLARVTKNVVTDTRRSESSRRRRELSGGARSHPATDEVVDRMEAHRELVVALLALGEPYRKTLILRFYENCDVREISERMDVPEPTVRTRLRRGLDRLRQGLERPGPRRDLALPLSMILEALAVSTKSKSVLATILLLVIATSAFLLTDWTGDSEDLDGDTNPAIGAAPDARRPEPERVEASTEESGAPSAEEAPAQAAEVLSGTVVFMPIPRGASLVGTTWRFESASLDPVDPIQIVIADARRVSLPAGTWRVACTGEGWRPLEDELRIESGEASIVWVSRPARLIVRVTDLDAMPIADADVGWQPTQVELKREFGGVRQARTDANGRVSFEDLPCAIGQLRIGAAGYTGETLHFLSESEGEMTVVLEPLDEKASRARFIDNLTRKPLEGVWLETHAGLAASKKSDAEGWLSYDPWALDGKVLVATREGYAGVYAGVNRLRGNREIAMHRKQKICVQVIDTLGKPVSGSEVRVEVTNEAPVQRMGRKPSLTGVDGTVELEVVPGIGMTVSAITPEGLTGRATVGSDGETAIQILTKASDTLRIQARDEDGDPVATAWARVFRNGGRSSEPSRADSNGVITVPDPDRVHFFEVKAQGRVPIAFRRAHGATESCCGELEIVLPVGHELSGRVRTADGSPLEGVRVRLRFDVDPVPKRQPPHPVWENARGLKRDALCVGDASFRFGGLPEGNVRLNVELPHALDPSRQSLHDTESMIVSVPHDGEVEFVSASLRMGRVAVFDDVTGIPVRTFRLERIPAAPSTIQLKCRSRWQGWLPSTTQALIVSAKGYANRTLPLPEGEVDLEVRLAPSPSAHLALEGDIDELAGQSFSLYVFQPVKGTDGRTHYAPAWFDRIVIKDPSNIPFSIPFDEGTSITVGAVVTKSVAYWFEPSVITWKPGSTLKLRVTAKPK